MNILRAPSWSHETVKSHILVCVCACDCTLTGGPPGSLEAKSYHSSFLSTTGQGHGRVSKRGRLFTFSLSIEKGALASDHLLSFLILLLLFINDVYFAEREICHLHVTHFFCLYTFFNRPLFLFYFICLCPYFFFLCKLVTHFFSILDFNF